MRQIIPSLHPEIKGATFSECGLYRTSLWRVWDKNLPMVMFIGLNPSTANANTDDPTIKRVRQISKWNGYGGFYMCNCYSYISTNPDMLKAESLEAMMENAQVISRCGENVKEVVFAWGNFRQVTKEISQRLIKKFPNAKALYINKNGSPKHPLYCKYNTSFIPFKN